MRVVQVGNRKIFTNPMFDLFRVKNEKIFELPIMWWLVRLSRSDPLKMVFSGEN
jgi:hypothetical protein